MKLHFTAAEASGDLLARETMEAIRERDPDVEFVGIGGVEMAKLGIVSPIDISPLSIVGLFDGLKVYGTVLELADAAADHIIEARPDAAVLVDSWGFCVRVGERVRARAPDIRLVKLVGPQIWATRPGRARILAKTFDQVLCIHAMELPFYEGLDIEASTISVPAFSRGSPGDKTAFCRENGLDPEKPILLVLPGSRGSELRRVAPALMKAAELAIKRVPGLQVVVMPAEPIWNGFQIAFPHAAQNMTVLEPGRSSNDAMAAANYALACSGTVTSELALQGTPMLAAYKLGWMTWLAAKYVLYKHKHITLMNIAAGDTEIVPEFVQADMKPDAMADVAVKMLQDPAARDAQTEAQHAALRAMGHGERPAADRAAIAIIEGILKSA
ncbi:MAG: lipid-A-disaccharide synthase [Pseudomonadota bacterium]